MSLPLRPRTKVPSLDLPTLDERRFTLSDQKPRTFSMLVFYRGLHCPICAVYLRDLDRRMPAFLEQGVETVAISADTRERAAQSRKDWGIVRLSIAYGLSVDQAREGGLFISGSLRNDEPPLFAEPGLFLVRPDGTLYGSSVQSMPFGRPLVSDLLAAIKFVNENDYPARGDV